MKIQLSIKKKKGEKKNLAARWNSGLFKIEAILSGGQIFDVANELALAGNKTS